MLCLVAQLCLTFCNPMDCSPPGSSVNLIFQAGIREWVARVFSRGSSWLSIVYLLARTSRPHAPNLPPSPSVLWPVTHLLPVAPELAALLEGMAPLHWGCFHVLATVNGATMNIGVQVSFQIAVFIFSRYMLSSRSVGSYSNSIFRLLRKLWNILHWGYTLLVPLSLSQFPRETRQLQQLG